MQVYQKESDSLRYLKLEPEGYDPDISYPLVIMLHGYGANMNDLASLCPSINPRGYLYVLPNAPIPLESPYGINASAWIVPPDLKGDMMAESTSEILNSFVLEITKEYKVEVGKIILGGFSQGGMMSYYTGLLDPGLFAGVAAMSARIPGLKDIRRRLPKSRRQHIFISHGTNDQVIEVSNARTARRLLEDEGYSPQYHEYNIAHEITQDVIINLAGWIHSVLPPLNDPS